LPKERKKERKKKRERERERESDNLRAKLGQKHKKQENRLLCVYLEKDIN